MINGFMINISQEVNRVFLGLKSRITPINLRNTSDSILSRICLASLILLMLGGFSMRAWGDEYVLSIDGGLDPDGNTENGQLVYETPIFSNPVGIDQISYTYNVWYGDGVGNESKTMIVEYSLDGTNYQSFNTKPFANNGSVSDAISASDPARYAVRFRFRAGGGNCWRTLWSLKIRKAIYAGTITKNGTNDWKEIKGDSVTWPGNHVTFKLSGGHFSYYSDYQYFKADAGQTHTVSWRVNSGYTISATQVSIDARTHVQGYVTVGNGTKSDNIYGLTTSTIVNSNVYNPALGNNGTVAIVSETPRNYCNFFIKTINVTYTIVSNYKVHFNANGGSGSMSDQNFVCGTAQDLTSNAFTRDGYQFAGWTTNADGSGTTYTNEQSVINLTTTANGTVNLYAKWVSLYKVRFNANGGTGSMSDQNFVYGTAQNLTANGFTHNNYTVTFDANSGTCDYASLTTDYTFSGWATSAGGGVEYADGASVNNLTSTPNGIFNLYAKWTGGSVTLPTPTRSGYVFAGWYDENENFIGNAGASYTPTADITLKAHWKRVASSANSSSDVEGGKIVIDDPHAIFTFSGATDIYYYNSDGYALASDFGQGTCAYSFTWVPKNSDCQIQVTRIAFWSKAYNMWAATPSANLNLNGRVIFAEKQDKPVGTAALTSNEADYAKFDSTANFSSGVPVVCNSVTNMDWDFYIKKIVIEYTITPKAPTPHNANLAATLSESDKQTLDVRIGTGSLFTMTDPADDFEYAYRLKEDYANAHLEDGYFWATATGDYEIQARVISADDHEASAWSTCTVHVTRTCVFNNTTGDKEWGTTDNWAYNIKPTADDAVSVLGDLAIDEEIEMLGLSIGDTAVVAIAPTGGLTVGVGGINGASKDKLILRASTAGQTGYLRISPDYKGDMPEATVELYTKAYVDYTKGKVTWQYMGIPMGANIGGWDICTYGEQFIYGWESASGWYDAYGAEIEPFKGYCLTQNNHQDGKVFTFTGQLAAPKDTTINLGTGDNVLANSYAAPIDISKLKPERDFVNTEATIYIFNTGSYNEAGYTQIKEGEVYTTAGQYIAVTPGTAAEIYAADKTKTYPVLIPAMQGFFVKATGSGASITLNYDSIVWSVNYETHPNKPMRVAAQMNEEQEAAEPNVTDFIRVTLSDGESGDNLYLLASESYDKSYENGYDAPKMMSDDASLPNIFAVEDDGQLAIDATSDMEGTFLGVRTGAASSYTMYFTHVNCETEWMLLDIETNQKTLISEGISYSFSAEPGKTISDRFLIVESDENSGTTTGSDEVIIESKVQKIIYNGHLLILKDGVLYDAWGRIVCR